MKGKFTRIERTISLTTFLMIVVSIMICCLLKVNDAGTIVMLGFTDVLIYSIFSVCALFPADWRMTEKQKSKIKNIEKYQSNYRKSLILVAFVLCLFIDLGIIFI